MIIIGSTNTSTSILLTNQDGNGVIQPIDLTGMTLEARFYDSGPAGAVRGIFDYGFPRISNGPLLTIPMGDGSEVGQLVVDDATNGQIHYSLTPGQSNQLGCNSRNISFPGKRRLVCQIWRTDTGAESMLKEMTEWARY